MKSRELQKSNILNYGNSYSRIYFHFSLFEQLITNCRLLFVFIHTHTDIDTHTYTHTYTHTHTHTHTLTQIHTHTNLNFAIFWKDREIKYTSD